jgi:hypothetical protein
VQDSFAYVQIYLDDGGWRPHRAGDVLRNRYGDCKDLSHVMVGLLSAAGIQAVPALIRAEGPFLPSVPARGQFDHCIVALPRPIGGWRFFDPTSRSVPLGRVPSSLEGRWALVTSTGPDSALIQLPESSVDDNCIFATATLSLDAIRSLRITLEEKRTGHCAFGLRRWLREHGESDRREWLSDRCVELGSDRQLVELELEGLEPESDTLIVRAVFEEKRAGKPVREEVLLGIDPWRRRETYFGSEIDEAEMRYRYRDKRRVELLLPQGWSVADPPADVWMDNAVGLLDRRITAHDDRVIYERVEEARVRTIPDDLEAAARAWDEAGYRADRQSLILQRR